MEIEITHSLTKELETLGLSTVEAKILTALLTLKKAPASEIARVTKLGRSEVYRKLPRLAVLGVVRKIPGPPDIYEAYEIQEILDCLYQEQATSMRQRLRAMKETEQKLITQVKMIPEIREQRLFKPKRIVITNKRKVLDEILRALKKSTQEILCVLDVQAFKLLYSAGIINYMLKRASRKVSVRLILQFHQEQRSLVQSLERLVNLRYIAQVAFNTIIVDRDWILTYSSSSDAFEATVTVSQDFASREGIIFDQLWKTTRSLSSMTYEQLVGSQVVKAVKGIDEAIEIVAKTMDRATARCMMVFDTQGYISLGWLLKNRPPAVDLFKMAIFKGLQRGVKWQLVAAGSSENMEEISDLLSLVEVRVLPKATTQFMLSENGVMVQPPNVENLSPENLMFFSSEHEAMIETFWGIGNDIWNAAKPVPMPTKEPSKPSMKEEQTKAKSETVP